MRFLQSVFLVILGLASTALLSAQVNQGGQSPAEPNTARPGQTSETPRQPSEPPRPISEPPRPTGGLSTPPSEPPRPTSGPPTPTSEPPRPTTARRDQETTARAAGLVAGSATSVRCPIDPFLYTSGVIVHNGRVIGVSRSERFSATTSRCLGGCVRAPRSQYGAARDSPARSPQHAVWAAARRHSVSRYRSTPETCAAPG